MERCELLNRYDANEDGTMQEAEAMVAIGDHVAGNVTREDLDAVAEAWRMGEGGIDELCPPVAPLIMVGVFGLVVLCILTR